MTLFSKNPPRLRSYVLVLLPLMIGFNIGGINMGDSFVCVWSLFCHWLYRSIFGAEK